MVFLCHVRLGTCIALELVLAAGLSGGVCLAVGAALDFEVSGHEAAAATQPRRATGPLPGAHLRVEAPAVSTTVYDAPDDVLLAPLAATPVTRVKVNHGGTSLSLRLEFASGARAAFKPQQVHPQSDPRREIAAYRVDRLLEIGHVPPAKPVALHIEDLIAAADPPARTYTEQRITDEAIARGGIVRGELSWWIPEIRDMTIGKYRVDEPDGMAAWIAELQVGGQIAPEHQHLVEQLSTCVVFDVLIDNSDRWTGNNTKCSVDQKTLYFMDNTLAFSIFTYGHEANLTPLHRIQVFSRKLVDHLRTLTPETLTAALDLGDDPAGMAPLLQPEELRALLARRDHILSYVDALVAQFGENAVLALP